MLFGPGDLADIGRSQQNNLWIRVFAAGIAVVGVALTLAFVGIAMHAENADEARLIDHASQGCYDSIRRNLEAHMVAMEAVRAYVAASDSLDQARFSAFVAPLLAEIPGVHGLEWAPYVKGEDLARFEAAAAADFPRYRVRETDEQGRLVPVLPRGEHAPVRLVHPVAGNERAVGFDLASQPDRLAALNRARESGLARATEPLTLVQESGSQTAYLVFLPVPDRGCVLGVFRAGDVLAGALAPLSDLPLDVVVTDAEAAEAPPLYAHGNHVEGKAATTVAGLDVAGRPWRLEITTHTTDRGAMPPFGLLVLAGGLAVTSFAVALLLMVARQQAAVASALAARTSELRDAEELLRTVADLSSELVYWRRPDGSLAYVSPAAASVTGYAAEAVAARPELLADMVHPADRDAWREHELRVAAGEACTMPDFRIISALGEERWIRHRCRPLRDASGANLGVRASNSDVTTAHTAAQDLQRERKIFTGGPVAVFRWRADAGWSVDYASPNAPQVCGDAYEDLLAGRLTFLDLVHPDDRERIAREIDDKARAGHVCFEREYRIAAPGLPVRWYHDFTVVVRDDAGTITHFDGYLLDMTERVNAHHALEQTTDRLELALAGADLGLWDWDVKSGQVVFDERWCAMLGYRPDELSPTVETWADLVHHDDMPRVMHALQRHLEGQTPGYETEHRLRHRSGDWVWVLDRGKVIARDEHGLPLRAAGTHQDITARRREQARDRRGAALRESAAVRLSACDDEGDAMRTVGELLAEAGELLAVPRGFLLRRDPDDDSYEAVHAWQAEDAGEARPLSPGDLDALGAWWDEQSGGGRATLAVDAAAGRLDAGVAGLLAGRGTTGLLMLSVALRQDLLYVLGFECTAPGSTWRVQDIETLRIILESFGHAYERILLMREHEATRVQLMSAFERAEQANLVKSTFLARMSHEIRTPLTAILGFADILERSREHLSDRDFYWVGQIRSNADHLVALLNDLLDISKIEAKELRVGREPVDVRAAVDIVATAMREKAAEKMLAFSVDVDDDVPATVVADGLRLRQILVNLVGNAVKFTDKGEVGLAVRRRRDARAGSDDLLFIVRDTGIGIAADQLEAVFQPFQQAAGLDHARFGGTGLGLDISRRLARMMGGELSVVSEPGHGSTFTARLPVEVSVPTARPAGAGPAAASHGPAPAAAPRPDGGTPPADHVVDGARILLVDDNPDNRVIVSFYLEEAGIIPDTAEDGAKAVAAVTAAIAAGRPYDLVLMDMRMPVMDGYEATRALRRQGVTTPIVALTAHAMAGDSQACLNFGCNGYLAKPIEPQTLIETVATFVGRRTPAAPATAATPAAAPRTLHSAMADQPRFAAHLARYLDGLGRMRTELAEALDAADVEVLQSLTHRLHGTGASFGYPDISRVAADCENALRAGAEVADVTDGVEELKELLAAALRGADRAGEPSLV